MQYRNITKHPIRYNLDEPNPEGVEIVQPGEIFELSKREAYIIGSQIGKDQVELVTPAEVEPAAPAGPGVGQDAPENDPPTHFPTPEELRAQAMQAAVDRIAQTKPVADAVKGLEEMFAEGVPPQETEAVKAFLAALKQADDRAAVQKFIEERLASLNAPAQ